MFGKLRLVALLLFAAPLPVLVQLGLRDETGAITAAGAGFSFTLAILAGIALFNIFRGLMRMPLVLLVIGVAVLLIGTGA